MVRWKPKSCPRCGGDTFIDRDMNNWYEQCLQCSHRTELKKINENNKPVSVAGRLRKKKAVSKPRV